MPSKHIWDIQPYQQTMAAYRACSVLSEDQSLGVISGVIGAGKSFCAREHCEANPQDLLVECPPRTLLTSPRAILDVIAEPLGIPVGSNTSRRALAEAIICCLRDGRGMLLLDEADRLTTNLADLLRYISEQSGRPVCMIGAPRLADTLKRHEPLNTRVGFRYDVRPATVQDLSEMFPRTHSAEVYQETIRVTRGNLRSIKALWPKLADIKRQRGAVTARQVRAVAGGFLLLAHDPDDLTEAEERTLGLAVA